jgi:putative molybdopterin biosynthesis protein
MEDSHLYKIIAETIRKDIVEGRLKPGDRLPPLRSLTGEWNCTPSTVQHAYHELAQEGLIISRPGRGTHVSDQFSIPKNLPLRRASLVNRMESLLLELLTSGYTPFEVEQAMELALVRWKSFDQAAVIQPGNQLRFKGSHDPAMDWVALHFPDFSPEKSIEVNFTGSLGGLIALVEGKADLAGCHLWDEESDSYNGPFVKRLLPGRKMLLLTLTHRRLGFLVAPGNPHAISDFQDLKKSGVRFLNRQGGSGTRVWLDFMFKKNNIIPANIDGYNHICLTHSELARKIAEGHADVGVGLEASAISFGLDFIFLTKEKYDLVIPAEYVDNDPFQLLIKFLNNAETRRSIAALGGYDVTHTGDVDWVI